MWPPDEMNLNPALLDMAFDPTSIKVRKSFVYATVYIKIKSAAVRLFQHHTNSRKTVIGIKARLALSRTGEKEKTLQPMRRIIAAALVALGTASGAIAQSGPVVIELYTSQGCSSCPPADALLAELATRDDVLPLSLHVDYWDYIGWKDKFASPAYTKRQKSYAQAAGRKMVYTPQMILDGGEHVVGNKTMEVLNAIERAKARADRVEIVVSEGASSATISVSPVSGSVGKTTVQLVRFTPKARVDVKRGENSGKVLTYTNVVTHWQVLTDWNGRSPLRLQVPRGDEPGAIIVQREGFDEVLAAARLR